MGRDPPRFPDDGTSISTVTVKTERLLAPCDFSSLPHFPPSSLYLSFSLPFLPFLDLVL